MPVKITLLFQESTGIFINTQTKRIAGWSETFYSPQNTVAAVIPAVMGTGGFTKGLAGYRATMLTVYSACVGQRFQVVAPNLGPSQSLNAVFPGTYFVQQSIAGTALLCKVPSIGASNIRRMILRGLPGTIISDGEYSPGPLWTTDITNFFSFLQGYAFRGRDLTQPTNKLINISASGLVTGTAALPYAIGQMVRVLKARDVGGRLRGGLFQVTATGPANTNVQLLNWPFGAATGGAIRLDGVVYPLIDYQNITVNRVITRKVGRPFVQFRGRRSARH